MMPPKKDLPPIDPLANETRRSKRELLLGENPTCLLCGIANVDALMPVPRSILEAHHVCGRANDGDLTVPLCRNCHAEVTEGYREAGVPLNRPPTLLHKLAAILRALGAFLSAVGRTCTSIAESLIALVARLDALFPIWRTWQEAAP